MDVASGDVMESQVAVGHIEATELEVSVGETGLPPIPVTSATPAIQDLYHGFVVEEFKEFVDATDDAHKLQEAMDLIWVTIGYCHTRGWDVAGAWDTLFNANMSKLQVDPATGELKRRADGKILKPENWKKPDFTPFVSGV
jgi:hypothetical protein